jgi:hypothetical protein
VCRWAPLRAISARPRAWSPRGEGQLLRQFIRVAYDLKVLDIRESGLTSRYTIREVTVTHDRGPAIDQMSQAYVGLPFGLETNGAAEAIRTRIRHLSP